MAMPNDTPEDASSLQPAIEDILSARDVASLLARAAVERRDAVYARLADGAEITIGELAALVDETARRLAGLGVDARSRVAVGMSNSVDHVVIIFSLYTLGAVWVPLNPKLRGLPLTHVLSDCLPTHALLEDGALPAAIDSSLLELSAPASARAVGRLLDRGIDVLALDIASDTGDAPAGLRAIMYTSGTTGAPKGVMVTDTLLLAAAAGCLRVTCALPGDVLYIWEPLHHIGGAQVLLLPLIEDLSLALGPAFDRRTFWRDVAAAGATHVHYLGGTLQMLLKEDPSAAERMHSVRIAWGAGATPQMWRECEERFGIVLHECYGATETSSVVTVNTHGATHGIGRPLPWFDIRLGGSWDEGGGELEVRPHIDGLVTPGYWRNPAATASARDGEWWRTGDLVSMSEDGAIRFVGRVADGIRVRGENLSAWLIESAFDAHPTIAKSAIVGVDSEYGEQDLLLFVQPVQGERVDIPELARWAAERLPSLYQPRYAKVVEEFELTPSRRVRKGMLDRDLSTSIDFHDEMRRTE